MCSFGSGVSFLYLDRVKCVLLNARRTFTSRVFLVERLCFHGYLYNGMYKKNNKATYVGFFFVIVPPKKAVNIWITSVLSASRLLKKNLMWCSTDETDGSLENHKHPAKFSTHSTSEADILSSRSLLYLLHWILMHICCLEGHFHVKLPHLMAF